MLAAVAGCSSIEQTPTPTNDANNLRGIIRYYVIAARNLGRPPKNMDELQAVLVGAVDDPSSYFRSNRDGQEYVVVWGLNLEGAAPDTIIAYERTGIDGKRLVMPLSGEEKEVTPEEFAKLKFPKDYTPES